MKYAAYDASGNIIGFYDSEISPVPEGVQAIAITEAQWQMCLQNPGYTVVDGVLTPPPPVSGAALLEMARQTCRDEVEAACQSASRSGFYSDALGAPYYYELSSVDELNLLLTTLVASQVEASATSGLRCADGQQAYGFRQHTREQVLQVAGEGRNFISSLVQKKVELYARIDTALTEEELQAIVW